MTALTLWPHEVDDLLHHLQHSQDIYSWNAETMLQGGDVGGYAVDQQRANQAQKLREKLLNQMAATRRIAA